MAVTKKPLTMHASRALWTDAGERKKRIRSWQDRIRDPSLSVLLVLQICVMFFAVPLAARGLPVARPIGDTLLFAGVAVVVLLSQRRGAIVVILFGLAAMLASFLPEPEWLASIASPLRQGGSIVTFSALTWVVLHAVYAPGRITFHRLQGAVVVYLNLATIFATIFSLIWESNPSAFVNLATQEGGLAEVATMLYFSLTTLTTTGYGDIVPVDPFARSLANLESVAGQFYLAITVARLVTLEMADRRR
jgi:voltage-gated potassium channel Kch